MHFAVCRKGKKKPVEPEIKENKPYLEEQYVNSFIREISEVKELVPLPSGIDLYEWIATNSTCFKILLTSCTTEYMSELPVPKIFSWFEQLSQYMTCFD